MAGEFRECARKGVDVVREREIAGDEVEKFWALKRPQTKSTG
jgi:hypothetical protein